MSLISQVPKAWREQLKANLEPSLCSRIADFLAGEKSSSKEIFPPENQRFAALELTAPEAVKVVILGQDPYHDLGQANGLAFSVASGVKLPPSLRNIFKELASDLNCTMPINGDLTPWAKQGVLLLNSLLSVEAHKAFSHRDIGWEEFTDRIIEVVAQQPQSKVFILWGGAAQSKAKIISGEHNLVLCSAHPSPLSAYRGFFGSRPFSQINRFLSENGVAPINWQLENDSEQLELELVCY